MGKAIVHGVRARGNSSQTPTVPSWVTDVSVNEWGVVPIGTTWTSLNPASDAAINPNHPGSAPWAGSNGFTALITAWCGGCTDGSGNWFNVIGGGHGDYYGNDAYKLALNSESPVWSRLSVPSGALPGSITLNDSQESSGVYSDGRARAGHSYNKVIYDPTRGPVWVEQGGSSVSGASGSYKPVFVSASNGAHTIINAASPSSNTNVGAAVYDSSRDSYWLMKVENGGWFYRYAAASQAWDDPLSGGGDTHAITSGYLSACYLPDDDCILVGTSASGWRVYDCATRDFYTPSVSGSGALDGDGGTAGLVWSSYLGAVVGWDNSSSTTLVTKITPGADPRTSITLSTMTVGGGNATTPAAKQTNGTYGRFFDWPAAKCLFVIAGQGANDVYFYRYG